MPSVHGPLPLNGRAAARIVCGVALVAFAAMPALAQDWKFSKTIPTQRYTPVFLATTPTGDVAAAAFNNHGKDPAVVPLILIHKPLSENPQYFAVCTQTFAAQRGFSGVAVDQAGNYYVAADTGDGATSWIRKYRPDGKLDASFARGGELSMGKRFLGLAVSGRHMFTTTAFGQLHVLDAATGRLLGSAQPPRETVYIRDIAVDPARQVIYGVARGAVWAWADGTFDAPQGYQLRRLSADAEKEAAGEGIYFDAFSGKALVPHRSSGSLVSIDIGQRGANESRIVQPGQGSAVADPVLLADGVTLFVSDMLNSRIYVMGRSAAGVEGAAPAGDMPSVISAPGTPTPSPAAASPARATVSPAPASAPAAVLQTGNVSWFTEYEKAADESRSTRKPLLLYFRTQASARAQELESGYLTSSEFGNLAKGVVPCAIDLDTNVLLAQQFGVFRVPVIALYTPNGDRLTMISGNIQPGAVTAALSDLAKQR
jgi:hypothetical protein